VFPLSVIPLASIAGAVIADAVGAILADKGTNPPRNRWFHGTSATAVPSILREGFKAGTDEGDWTLSKALVWWAGKPWKGKNETAWELDFHMFAEEAGTPIPGYVYLSREADDTLTRGEDALGGTYVFEVEPTGPMIPDEDCIGRSIGNAFHGDAEPSRLDAWAAEVREMLSPDVRRDVDVAARDLPLEDFQWGCLVGKAVVADLTRTSEGRALLERGAAVSPRVAHLGSPRVVALWRRDVVQKPYKDSTGIVWKTNADRWVRVPVALDGNALVTR
jgi:hypothetical protein